MSDYGKGSITLERGQYRVRMPNGRGGHVTIGYYDTLELIALEGVGAADTTQEGRTA